MKKTFRKIYRKIRSAMLDAIAVVSATVIIAGLCLVDCGLTALSWTVMGVAFAYLAAFIWANRFDIEVPEDEMEW
jgi:hypothetical protein